MDQGIRLQIVDYASRLISFAELDKRTRQFLGKQVQVDLMQELQRGAIEFRNKIVLSMRNSPATGKRYRVGTNKKGKGVYKRASSPGNPPRPNSGDLIRSIVMDARALEVEVGSNITRPAYPLFLEKGTKRMEARPWLAPAVNKIEPRIKFNMRRILRQAAAEYIA